jgi:hypothetical protein
MSLQLLKHCLEHDFYEKHKSTLSSDLFPSDVKKAYKVVVGHFEQSDTTLSAKELSELFFSQYPSISSAEKKNFRILFQNLEDVNEQQMSAEVAETLLRREKLKQNATTLATEALNMADGHHLDFDKMRKLVEQLQQQYMSEDEDFVALTADLDELLAYGDQEQKWKFPLESFNEKLGGIGPGIFGLITARPNAGKTACVVSFIFHPQGWAAQGAKVALFCNEEAAFRTMKRGITCYTGVEPSQWQERKEEVSKKWKEVKDNILVFDVVGMSLPKLDAWMEKHKPDIIVIDQLDKVRIPSNTSKPKHEEIRELYTLTREVGKKYNCAVVGVGQASAEAEGKLFYSFDMLEHSKTGKGAETDFIITIGKRSLEAMGGEDDGYRQANIVKNKITGNECSVAFTLDGALSRICP